MIWHQLSGHALVPPVWLVVCRVAIILLARKTVAEGECGAAASSTSIFLRGSVLSLRYPPWFSAPLTSNVVPTADIAYIKSLALAISCWLSVAAYARAAIATAYTTRVALHATPPPRAGYLLTLSRRNIPTAANK